jgi:hypothetical protein
MWVKGTLLYFIIDRKSQKNLILAKVIKQLGLSKTPHPYHTTYGGFGKDEFSVSTNSVNCHAASNPSRMRYYVMLAH